VYTGVRVSAASPPLDYCLFALIIRSGGGAAPGTRKYWMPIQVDATYSLVKERITVIGIEEEHNCTVVLSPPLHAITSNLSHSQS